jgi:hypothetical protein
VPSDRGEVPKKCPQFPTDLPGEVLGGQAVGIRNGGDVHRGGGGSGWDRGAAGAPLLMIRPAIWAVIRRVWAPRCPLLLRTLDGRVLIVPASAVRSALRLSATATERRMTAASRRQRSSTRAEMEP